MLFPSSLACARFLRPRGGKLFLVAHASLNVAGLVFLSAGLAMANQYVQAQPDFHTTGHYAGPHQKMGLALYILVWLQAAGGALRPHPPADGASPSKTRALWERVHRPSGALLQCLGLVTAFAGIVRVGQEPGVSKGGVAAGGVFWVLWIAGLGALFVHLEKKRKASAAASAPAAGPKRCALAKPPAASDA